MYVEFVHDLVFFNVDVELLLMLLLVLLFVLLVLAVVLFVALLIVDMPSTEQVAE